MQTSPRRGAKIDAVEPQSIRHDTPAVHGRHSVVSLVRQQQADHLPLVGELSRRAGLPAVGGGPAGRQLVPGTSVRRPATGPSAFPSGTAVAVAGASTTPGGTAVAVAGAAPAPGGTAVRGGTPNSDADLD